MMPTARKIALALGFVGAGAALGAWYFHTPRRAVRPIDAVPADAFIAVDINVAGLRKSGALATLFGDRDEQSLTKVCGFDPVDRMEDLVFVVPEDGNGTFGVAVQAGLSQSELVGCANEVVKAHGGDPTSDVVARGSYSVITPRSLSSDPAKPGRSLGFKAGSPILVGPKSWLYSMVDALDDASLGKGSSGEHAALRERLTSQIVPTPTFLVTATALLEKRAREKLRAEMLAEVGAAEDVGTSMMLGVLGMSSGVLGLYEAGDDIHAVVRLHCEEESQCVQVAKLVSKVRDEWSKMEALRAFGLGPVLDHVKVKAAGLELDVETSAATADVVRWTRLFMATRSDSPASAAANAQPPQPVSPPVADPANPQFVAQPASSTNVPRQTVRIRVPDGVEPGQPFTVRIPKPGPSSNAGVRILSATVPSPTAAPSGNAVHQ